jgi:hypothetical protein
MSRIRALPSPAMVVALLALVAGITGAAIAKGGRTVTKKQAKTIANNQILAKAPGLSVSHAGTAGTAGSATSAETVGGQRVIKVFAKLPSPTPSFTTIANLGGGFELQAACPNVTGAELRLAFTQSIGVDMKAGLISSSGSSLQEEDTTGPTSIDLSDSILGETSFSGATTSGTVVSGTVGFDTPGSFSGELVCAFYGHVTEG